MSEVYHGLDERSSARARPVVDYMPAGRLRTLERHMMNKPTKTYPVMTRDEAMKDMRARIYAEGLSLYDAASESSQHRRNFQRLLNGSCELSPEMAVTIGRLTDTDPMPWVIAYAAHHLEQAAAELNKETANG